jgi:hypothetical protein
LVFAAVPEPEGHARSQEMLKTVVSSHRRLRRPLAAGGALLLAGALFAGVATTIASAAPSPDDPRAELHDAANATTCADVGFPNDSIVGSGGNPQASGTVTVSPDNLISVTISDHVGGGQEINITVTPPALIHATIVKGGNAYNQYPGSVLNALIAPFVGNNEIPQISHWFICYDPDPPVVPPSVAGTSVVVTPRFTG